MSTASLQQEIVLVQYASSIVRGSPGGALDRELGFVMARSTSSRHSVDIHPHEINFVSRNAGKHFGS